MGDTLNPLAVAISEDDKQTYETIVQLLEGAFFNADPALVSTTLTDGTPVTVIAAVATNDEGTDVISVEPLAILVTGPIMDRLAPPITED